MTTKTIVVLLLLTALESVPMQAEASKRSIRDGKARCQDFGGIKRQIVSTIETKTKDGNKTVFSVPSRIEVDIMKRDVWNSYCYHGSAIDPNTGCTPQGTTVLLPDEPEAKAWRDNMLCKIGVSCRVDQEDCKGDGARKCLYNELTRWVKESKEGYGEWWQRFPHHTCSKLWNCEIKKRFITPVITFDGGMRVEVNLMDEWWVVYNDAKHKNYFKSDKHKMVIYVPDFEVKIGDAPIRCIENRGETECLSINSLTGSHEIVLMDNKKWSIGRTTAIKGGHEMQPSSSIESQREDVLRAASINDLKRVITSTHYTQAEIDDNFERVNMNFLKVANLLIGLIELETKKDDKSYSVITGDSRIVKWISPTKVRVCKVNENYWMENNSCSNGSYYAGGSYHSTQRYKCPEEGLGNKLYEIDMKLDSSKETTLYEVGDLGTTSSEKINRELAEERISKVESKIDRMGYGYGGSGGSPDDVLGYFQPSSVFSMISSYLVYINSIFIVLLCLRR